MSDPAKKHNCPLLNLFKSCGCSCDSKAAPAAHSHDHAHEQGGGDGHGHHHEHEHTHTHPHGGHDHEDVSGGQEHSHPHGHDHAHTHEHEHGHAHSHADEAEAKPEVEAAAAATGSSSDDEQAINADLQSFVNDISAFMDRQPPKFEEQAGESEVSMPLFDQAAIDEKAYVDARDEQRKLAAESEEGAEGRAAFAYNDRADNLVDSFSHSGLQSMENSGLMRARLSTTPWSDDYWGIYLGILGKRYADPGFPKSTDWQQNYNYVQSRSAASILASGNAAAIDLLSPSEKYDILVGDGNYTLTKKMWAEGERFYKASGSVATWMGICHGWAPAAYMLPRPTGTARVLAADGRTWLTFYPSDIKALASLLWAKVSPRSRFIGGRCNDRNPSVDPQNKRVLSESCFDTNPGTWHLAVVNQIGASRRSMVIDVTFDYEVWNQPTVGYSYRYFNPQRMVYQSSLAGATVSKSSFSNDKFAKYRSPQTDSMVGIVMDVSYTVETAPTHSSSDSPAADAIQTARYFYDLELDFSGKIIGGEWYLNRHPDFLWTPAPGDRAQTSWEPGGSWAAGQPVPANWRSAAASASGGSSAPLAAIVERLIELANN